MDQETKAKFAHIRNSLQTSGWIKSTIMLGELEEEFDVTEKLYEERDELLRIIPECPDHGPCLPYAKDWVKSMTRKQLEQQVLDDLAGRLH